jgi:homoserine dehydrogenase
VEGISGIFNGTSNYILSNMFRDGKSFEAALSDAQRLGFAELDPSSDVDGDDAKYKLILLAAHSLGIVARPSDVLNLGIRHLRQEDIVFARQRHGKIKLTPVSKRLEGHCLALYVLPSLVNEDHFLYHVENEFNGVEIYGTYSGVQHLKGRGAGSMPTGSALLSDLHALKQGYRYTYRKKKVNGHSVLEQDHKLFVYVRVPQQVPVDALPVSDIRIVDKSADTYAVVGWSTPQWLLEKKSWLEKQTAFVMQLPQNAV